MHECCVYLLFCVCKQLHTFYKVTVHSFRKLTGFFFTASLWEKKIGAVKNSIQLYIHLGSNIIGLFLAHYTCQTYSLIFKETFSFHLLTLAFMKNTDFWYWSSLSSQIDKVLNKFSFTEQEGKVLSIPILL